MEEEPSGKLEAKTTAVTKEEEPHATRLPIEEVKDLASQNCVHLYPPGLSGHSLKQYYHSEQKHPEEGKENPIVYSWFGKEKYEEKGTGQKVK